MSGKEPTATRPVRPRDAASLVLLRRRRRGADVLLGKRASAHRFMPDVYVFPGGRLDRSDRSSEVIADLSQDVAERLKRQASHSKARGLGVAAVRETWEETGLAIGQQRDGSLVPDLSGLDYVARAITPTKSPVRFHARFFMAEASIAEGEARDSRELIDLRWVDLEDALKLPIVDVTEFVLTEVARRVAGWTPPGLPLFSYRNGGPRIVYED